MLGAIIGDIVGSIYEFDNIKTKDFELFDRECFFTDDTVMSVAVAEALLDTQPGDKEDEIRNKLVVSMKKWGREYPYAGYGGHFSYWLTTDDIQPYNSYGNGSAMRVAAAGWLYDDMFTTRYMARLTSAVTHNHPEGIKGAEATAAAIFLARNGVSIGGDTDTLCAIAGSIAEAYYGIPEDIGETAKSFLTYDLLKVVEKFYNMLQKSQY